MVLKNKCLLIENKFKKINLNSEIPPKTYNVENAKGFLISNEEAIDIDEEEDLLDIGLGVSKSTVEQIQKIGFSVLIRLKNSKRLNAQLVKQKFKTIKELSDINTIMFQSDRVLGFPSQLELVNYYMKEFK